MTDPDKIDRIHALYGPWLSLGIHADFKHRYIELHFLWWIIRLGSRDPVYYCASCESEIGEQDTVCGKCGAEFGEAIE